MSDKIAVVIARDRYQSLEFNPVVDALKRANCEIVIASDEIGIAKGTQEDTQIEVSFKDIDTEELDGIVIIGGSNSLWYNQDLHNLLKEMDEFEKMIAAICFGSVTLATSGVLRDGDTACWYNADISDAVMEDCGVIDSELNVTVEQNVITGNGPNAAQEFAEAIVDYLQAQT